MNDDDFQFPDLSRPAAALLTLTEIALVIGALLAGVYLVEAWLGWPR